MKDPQTSADAPASARDIAATGPVGGRLSLRSRQRIGYVAVAAVWLLSLLPALAPPGPPGIGDKVEHLLAYGALTLWFAGALPTASVIRPAGLLVLMGGAIELCQAALPWRTASWADLAANVTGIVLALLVLRAWRTPRRP